MKIYAMALWCLINGCGLFFNASGIAAEPVTLTTFEISAIYVGTSRTTHADGDCRSGLSRDGGDCQPDILSPETHNLFARAMPSAVFHANLARNFLTEISVSLYAQMMSTQ